MGTSTQIVHLYYVCSDFFCQFYTPPYMCISHSQLYSSDHEWKLCHLIIQTKDWEKNIYKNVLHCMSTNIKQNEARQLENGNIYIYNFITLHIYKKKIKKSRYQLLLVIVYNQIMKKITKMCSYLWACICHLIIYAQFVFNQVTKSHRSTLYMVAN